jgi:hypothetical protein
MGRRALQGTLIGADTGRVVRSGLVALEPAAPSTRTLQALGQFLVDGKTSGEVIVRGGGLVGPSPGAGEAAGDAAGGGLFSARVMRWVLLGTAVGCAGAGIPLLALHGQPSCGQDKCPEEYDTLAGGVVLVAAAGAAAVASGVMFYLAARNRGDGGDGGEAGEDGDGSEGGGGDAGPAAVVAPWAAPGGAGVSATLVF